MSKYVRSLAMGLASLAGVSAAVGLAAADPVVAKEASFAAGHTENRYIYRTEAEALAAKEHYLKAGHVVFGPFPVPEGWELLIMPTG